MRDNILKRVTGAAFAALLVAGPLAGQDGGGDAQLLWGGGFRDPSVGNATDGGEMTTLTLEHVGGWALGDHFFFLDATSGTFDAAAGRGYRMYAEWTPRLSVSRVAGRSLAAGPVADVLLVGEAHAGSGGYAAGLIGPGVDLRLPGFAVASASVLYRNDSFNPGTWQVSGVWVVPARLGSAALTLTGFIDVIGDPDGGALVMTQPQLLVDVASIFGSPRRDVQVGVEWYLHQDGEEWHSVPQALVRWAW